MRTQSNFNADTAHGGGIICYGASDANWAPAANLVYTRNAAGDYSLNQAASLGPSTLTVNLADIRRLTIYPDVLSGATVSAAGGPNLPYQEAFGGGSGIPGQPPSGAPGMPPFTGATQLVPPSALPAKGLRAWKFNIVYLISGAALTLHTFNIYRTTYANNVANSVATPALSTTALQTAIQANPYVSTITVTSPVFETTDLSDLLLEVQVTTQASGAYRFYGVFIYVDFNLA